jgi:hypothetical protein
MVFLSRRESCKAAQLKMKLIMMVKDKLISRGRKSGREEEGVGWIQVKVKVTQCLD